MHESEMLNAKCGLQIGYYYASDLVFMTSKNTIQLVYKWLLAIALYYSKY